MADYFAPQAPSVTNSTAMANNAIMEGFTSAKHTYMKAQERIYQEVMTNFENAANAESLVAKNVGRKGWDELNMSLNDQYLNAINEIKKQQKLKPFDVELKNKLSTLQSKFQQTLSSISQTNQMFDNFSKLQAEGKLDSRLMTRGSNSFKQFLEDVDNGILSVDVNGTITNSKTGESGTFSEIIGGAIPESIYKIDEIDEMTSQLRRLRASDPEMKKIINEDGRIITKQSMTPSQKRKIDLYIKHSIFNNEGGLSQIGEIFEIQRQGAFAGVNNGAKAEELDGQGLVDYVKQFFGSDEEITGIAPEKEEKPTRTTISEQKQLGYNITMGELALGNKESEGALTNALKTSEFTVIKDGKTYSSAENAKIMDVKSVKGDGKYAKYIIEVVPSGKNTEEGKVFLSYDLNNPKELGEFEQTVATLPQYRGVDAIRTPIEDKIKIAKEEGSTFDAPQTIDSIISDVQSGFISNDKADMQAFADSINEKLKFFGVSAERKGSTRIWDNTRLKLTDLKTGETTTITGLNTEEGQVKLRKYLSNKLGGTQQIENKPDVLP